MLGREVSKKAFSTNEWKMLFYNVSTNKWKIKPSDEFPQMSGKWILLI